MVISSKIFNITYLNLKSRIQNEVQKKVVRGYILLKSKFWESIEEVRGIEGRLQIFRKGYDHNSGAIFSKEGD